MTTRALLPGGLSMDVLRSGLSSWATLRHREEGGDADDAIWALAATPALVADIARIRAGEELVEPRPELTLVENFMFKMSGRVLTRRSARARCVLHARRGARHERLDVHGTRDRVDAVRHRFGSRRRRRCAQGQAPTAARRATCRT